MKTLLDFDVQNVRAQLFELAEKDFRDCVIRGAEEDVSLELNFKAVVGIRKTNFKSLDLSEYENQLVELEDSEWLRFIAGRFSAANDKPPSIPFRHFALNVFDGPSYEVISTAVSVTIRDPLSRRKQGELQTFNF